MGRDTSSNTGSGGGGSSILTSILPCIRPRRSKNSTSEPDTEAKGGNKPQIASLTLGENKRGESSQSAGTALELPNTPLAEDEGDGLEATVMREFARVSVQPMSSPWLAEVGDSESKAQEAQVQRPPPQSPSQQQQSEPLATIPQSNIVPPTPQDPFSEPKETKPPVAEEDRREDPEPQPPTQSAVFQPEAAQETAQQNDTTDKTALEKVKGQEHQGQLETPEQEKCSEVPTVADNMVDNPTSSSAQNKSTVENATEDNRKPELLNDEPEPKGPAEKAEEAKDTTNV